ncbi:hypothetical protein OCU04_009315 [Sclerotinia nivalis]|uniref:RING-type E3 ubiquitin transferase n=1 Tax=Sclerotinia nivalis TaxID=352851 RepID=A0A9X0DGF2_9HELO|nr:hypothetical protein OCU04_009315 [Sclerotinia nivalis]
MSDEDCAICKLAPVSEKCSGKDEDCKICDQSVSWKAKLQPCGHEIFHYCCIEKWLETGSRTCPLCRGEITSVRHNFSEDGKHSKYKNLLELEFHGLLLAQEVHAVLRIPQQRMRRRLDVHLTKSFSLPIISFGQRKVTPQDIANSSDMEARVRLFAEHEIQVFYLKCVCPGCQVSPLPAHIVSVNRLEEFRSFVLDRVVDLLKRYDLRDKAVEIEQATEEYLNEHARLFLHELRAWIESPFETLDQWHRNAKYPDESSLTPILDDDSAPKPPQRPNLVRRNAGLGEE